MTIGNSAFQECPNLEKIVFPTTLSNYNISSICQRCGKLKDVTLPTNATMIGMSAFLNCTALPIIDIPSAVTSISGNAFSGCTSLTTIICRAVTPPTLIATALTNVPADCAIYVPDASVNDYKAASGWIDRATYIFPLSQYNP